MYLPNWDAPSLSIPPDLNPYSSSINFSDFFLTIATAKAVRTQGVGHPRSHHVNNLSRSNCLRMRLPGQDQHCSILFKSGEYGGKYNNLHPTLWINSSIRPPLWNVALSITTTCPVTSVGSKQVSSQISKTVRLQAPTTVKGASNFWLQRAAIIFTLPSRRPDLSAWKRCPCSFQP